MRNCFSKQIDLKKTTKCDCSDVAQFNTAFNHEGAWDQAWKKSDLIIFPFLNEASETWACKWHTVVSTQYHCNHL